MPWALPELCRHDFYKEKYKTYFMKKQFIITLMASSLLLFTACSDSAENDTVENAQEVNEEVHDDTGMEKDADFAVKAAACNMAETDLAQHAIANATSADVKKLAQGILDDHTTMANELNTTAMSKNITLPANMGEDNMDKVAKLKEKTGKDFDKEYIDWVIKDHKESIDLFEKESNNGNDADLKAWAAQKLATLRQHLEMAENIRKSWS